MRIASKIFLFLSLSCILGSLVFASSPFDIILGRAPDIAVTDIHQETSFVYMRVCNLGGSITDSDTSLALAMKITGGGIVSMVEPIILSSDDCHEFRIASVDELGIRASGTYDISAGAVLKDGRVEKATNNNKITKSVDITYPSKYTPIPQTPVDHSSSNSTYYCNSTNAYCANTNYSNSTTYYCIPGTSNCSTAPYSNYNSTYYCNSTNAYCANNTAYNGSNTYYRANICPPGDYACNNSYYNSTNTQYQNYNNNNQYCTYSNNYCNNNSNYYSNTQYNQPDLVVQKVYQNSSDKHIIAQICNQWGDMNNSASIRTSFVSNNTTASIYNTVQIGRGQCTSSIVYTTPAELGITYGGNYTVSVSVDTNNNLSEQNESNNTLAQSIFLETDRNQRSDLVVDRISSNDNNRTIVAHVCNIGDDMLDYNNWVMEISNTTTNSVIRNSGYRLSRGQCTDVNTSYASLGVYQSGGYTFRVVIDPDNAMSEQSRYNNTMTQYLQLWMNY